MKPISQELLRIAASLEQAGDYMNWQDCLHLAERALVYDASTIAEAEKKPLIGVKVSDKTKIAYWKGERGVTGVEWSFKRGPDGVFDTIVVFINGKLTAEYPFAACKAVYYLHGDFDRSRNDFHNVQGGSS